MEKEKRELKGAGELRRKAEERLKEKPAPPKKLPELETQELIQELRVHQIELEMQNEELRQTQAVVEESMAKYSDLYDFAPVGYLTLNRQGLILEANLTACSSLGKERSLLISINNLFTNFIIKKGEKDLFYQHLGKVFEAKSLETCELELKGKDNTKFYAQLQSTVVNDNLSQCRTAIINITENKRLEAKIKDSETRFKTIFEDARDGILLVDVENKKFCMCNKMICNMLGYTEEEIKHLTVNDIHLKKNLPQIIEAFEKQVRGEIKLVENLPLKRKDGSVFYTDINSSEITLSGKKYLMGSFRDITKRKKVEEALKKANEELQKLDQVKTDFVSHVSHELRTPLTIIKEGISLVLDKTCGEINEGQQKMLITAKNNIDRLANIINNLLDISKIEAGKFEFRRTLIDITELVRRIIEEFRPKIKQKGLELKIDIPQRPVDIYVDADKIVQIFNNLFNNTLKFTEKGCIEISLKDSKDKIECIVADTGIGIAQENLPKVFGKFQQFARPVGGTGEKGTGLGLSITQDLIGMHSGKIWVESELGKGTKFTFILPKFSAEMLFKEYINNGITAAKSKDSKMSLIVVSIVGFTQLKEKLGDEMRTILEDMQDTVEKNLLRKGDAVIRDTGEIVILLADCNKENVPQVEDRLWQGLKDYLTQKNLSEIVKIRFGKATYPDDAANDHELLHKAKSISEK